LSLDHPDWRALAACLALTALLASAGTYLATAPRSDVAIEDEIANDHHRSLLASSQTDVLSSDRHTVKPWFDRKLGLSPPTIDLAGEGFPLVGGRVAVVAGNAVPALVYRRRQHLITLVAMPQSAGQDQVETPRATVVDGYNTVHWAAGGFKYWAISDLDADELESFVTALGAR
jgi:anti-sigma factor RsiW